MRKTNAYKPHCCFCSPETYLLSVSFLSTFYLHLPKLLRINKTGYASPHTPRLLTKLGILAFFIFPLSRHSFLLFENENPGCSNNSGARCYGESLLAQRGSTQLTFPLSQRPRGKTSSPHSLKYPSTQRPSFLLLPFILCRLVPYFPS